MENPNADQTQEVGNGGNKTQLYLKQSWEIEKPDEQTRKPKQTRTTTKLQLRLEQSTTKSEVQIKMQQRRQNPKHT